MTDSRLARASAWMALGTIVSRITGLFRSLLLIAVLGTALNGDIFELANSIPSSLYILVAGGVFNVVLVPQLVRTMKNDADGGEAYANRIVTLGLLVLLVATVLLVFAVPLLMRIVFDPMLFTDAFTFQHDAARLIMLLCMPQVFFYGVFVLVGQILNARERFGPMMWAPIVNNVVSIAMLSTYALVFGIAAPPADEGFSTSESWLLGAGSTLGIALQALVLVPYLRSVGFRFRPRFDFRGVGLGHTLKLGAWTLGFIIVNQVAYFAIARLNAAATIEGADRGVPAAGQTVYALGFMLSQVPHGIITVSVATAILPTLASLAAAQDYHRFSRELGRTIRLVLVLLAPVAVALAALGEPVARVVAGFGAAKNNLEAIGWTITIFALAVVLFTLHYLVLRGFYALEDTKTPFWVQTVIAGVNVGAAFALSQLVEPLWVSTVLAASFLLAYVIGFGVSLGRLSRRIRGLFDTEMVSFVVRMVAVCAAMALVLVGGRLLWAQFGPTVDSPFSALLQLVVLSSAGLATVLLGFFVLRISEARYVLASLRKRRSTS